MKRMHACEVNLITGCVPQIDILKKEPTGEFREAIQDLGGM
jgi:hypothetical protein